jgi:ATP-dependent helicase/nuclease subunit A
MTAVSLNDGGIRDLISRTGLDQTLFVEAGAGTGKTTQLVARITNLVTVLGVPLRNIAAITFTEAAASELADRIRVAFEQTESTTDDLVVRERCRTALAEADLAAITTLHGFARRILSEHPLAVGLPPKVGVADEVASELAQEDRWDRFLDALYDDESNEELLVRAVLIGVPLEPRYPGQATLKDVAIQLGQSWDRLDGVAAVVHPPLPPVDFGPFDAAAADIEALPGKCSDPDDKYCRGLVEQILPAVRAIGAHQEHDLKLRAVRGADSWAVRGGKNGAWAGDVAAAKAVLAELNQARTLILGAAAHEVLTRLLTLVAAEVQTAAEERRAAGQLEFHDLLVLCRRLLRTSPKARRQLRDRYTHLLLDEFQDTDPIQVDLAVLIAATASAESDEAPDWDRAVVEPGRLFFVGDPKQSIYRFRRADIALFLQARETFAPDGSWLNLITNFRTVPAVLEWVNGLFAGLMPNEIPGVQPRHQPLVARRAPAPAADHRPVILGGPHEKASASELRALEAADVARTIAGIRADPAAWPIYDKDPRRWRPARLADITILVPTRTSLPYLRAALTEWGIPHRLDTGTLVYDTQEVTDLLAVLSAVDDPADQLSLITALRSSLYACADTDLFTYRNAGGRWNLRNDPPEGIPPDHPVVAALAHLRSLWEQRWWLTPSALLGRIIAERQAFVLAFGEEQPKEVWRRLRFLLDQARAFEEADGGGVRSFLEWADLQRTGSSRVHEPLLPETDDPSVRVMTVHGAKGLEFPITVLSGMTTRPGSRRHGVSVLWNDDGNPEIKLGQNVATANHDPHADLEAEMDVHEKLRLLYVACTRAQDHLVVACHHKEKDRSYANLVWQYCAENTAGWQTPPDIDPDPPLAVGAGLGLTTAGEAPSKIDRSSWMAAREALLAPQRRSRFVSATTIAAEAGSTAATIGEAAGATGVDALNDDAVAEGTGRPSVRRRRGRAGTAIGRAVHATLQVIDLEHPRDVDATAARQANIESIPELASTVAAMVHSALESPALQTLSGRCYHKEMYVATPIGERVIEGYVDLLVETPDGLVVIDYKTDTVATDAEAEAKIANYELQGAAYAIAIEAATELPVVACYFVFCRPAGAIERAVTDLPGAKERVLDYLSR